MEEAWSQETSMQTYHNALQELCLQKILRKTLIGWPPWGTTAYQGLLSPPHPSTASEEPQYPSSQFAMPKKAFQFHFRCGMDPCHPCASLEKWKNSHHHSWPLVTPLQPAAQLLGLLHVLALPRVQGCPNRPLFWSEQGEQTGQFANRSQVGLQGWFTVPYLKGSYQRIFFL